MRKSSIIKKYYFILSVVLFLLPTQTVIAVLPFDSDLNLVQQAQVERLIGELGVTNSAVMGNKFEKPKVNDSIPRIVDIAESRLEQIMKIERVTDESGSFFDQDDNLRQFGYDLFAGSPLTFAPITDAPIPSDYIIGPGDTINILFFGKKSFEVSLQVTRSGNLNIPDLGPIAVSGLSYQELKENLLERVATQMIGVKASISLGELRSIKIFVLGNVERPGSYTVNSLATLTNAIFSSGGIKRIGYNICKL